MRGESDLKSGFKDRETLLWIYKGSKSELLRVAAVIAARTLLTVLGVYFAVSSKSVIDAAASGDGERLKVQALKLVIIILSQILIKFFGNSLEERVKARLEMNFKSELFSSLLKKDYSLITAYHSGDLLTRLSSDVTVISDGIISLLPGVVSMLAGLSCAFFALVALDKTFAFLFLGGGIILLIIISFFRKFLKNMHKRVQETDSKVRSFFQEAILSILMIKIFSIEEKMVKRGERLQKENFAAKMKKRNVSIAANSGLTFIFSFASLFALLRCAFRLYEKSITFGTLTAVIQLVNQIQSPVAGLSFVLPAYFNILASAERIIEIEKIPDEDSGRKALEKKDYAELKSMNFENISFSYGRDNVLDDASCVIEKGDFVIISGISGIGKSTLMKLLLGVIYPDGGRIYLEKTNGEKIPAGKHIRPLFSYVPQGNLLMSGTIRETVSMIAEGVSDEEMKEAARIACADSFINKLPLGFETVIGEKGAGLSEGQVQRLAVMRAMLSGAPIILLDEATSALDEATEEKLLSNIKELKNKTCILISHKKAAYSICNKELKIENKKIYVKEI